MAKLSLGLGKNEPVIKDLPIETLESLYKKACDKLEGEPYILQGSFKREVFEKAAEMFAELGSYQDASEKLAFCREKIEEAKKEEIEQLYAKAALRLQQASTDNDYVAVIADCKTLGDYKDAPALLRKGQEGLARENRKLLRRRNTLIATMLVLAAAVIGGAVSGGFTYLMGHLYKTAGIYGKAESTFESLGTRFDSPAQRLDSELLAIREGVPGDSVNYGGYNFRILDKEEGKVRLILSTLDKDSELRSLPFDEGGAADWETSSLHTYLNTTFTEALEEEHLSYLTEMDGGRVTILEASEVSEYAEAVDAIGYESWLRTPGQQDGTMQILLYTGEALTSGIDVQSTQICTLPVIQIDLEKALGEG